MTAPRIARRIPVLRQRRPADCGAVCLRSITKYFGYRVPTSRLRRYASTSGDGTNVLGLVTAARRLGFAAKGVRGTFESLAHIPLPAIAHLVPRETLHHYVVLYEIAHDHLLVMDPAPGRLRRLTHEEFRALWSGVLVVLAPPPTNELAPPRSLLIGLRRRLRRMMGSIRGPFG